MRSYGQYCPIARASEILAERWTPIIMRNLLNGATTFTQIVDGAPGLSRTLLTSRLRELERAGVVAIDPNPHGQGHVYRPTEAGRDLKPVIAAMGIWGNRWLELAPEHLDPGMVLYSWVAWYLDRDRLLARRVVAEFTFPELPKKGSRLWVIFDGERSEVCQKHPGFEIELFVQAEVRALAEWHLGYLTWRAAVSEDRISVLGPPGLVKALPTWNRLSDAAWARPTT